MGCDIHMHVECKHDGVWKRHNVEIYDGRDYELFGILAGVRGILTPISYPKGLPVDVSNEVLQDHDFWEDSGRHSASWLTFDDVWNSRLYYDNHSFQRIAFDMLRIQREKQAEDVRIVFWFDS